MDRYPGWQASWAQRLMEASYAVLLPDRPGHGRIVKLADLTPRCHICEVLWQIKVHNDKIQIIKLAYHERTAVRYIL